jgi:UDP-glucose:(heptosyl)LPS alpha-1,3-glucosyltransferase
MEALALLRSQGVTNVRSLVIGRGVTPAWQQRNRGLGLEGHLTFTGPTDRAAALRDAADVLVHPTYYDPCSRVVLEALANGLPCVASRWDGSAEMIEPGVSGLVIYDPGDASALAEAVRKLLDPVLRAAMSEKTLTLRERISMASHAREMVALHTELLARKGQHGAILGRRDG